MEGPNEDKENAGETPDIEVGDLNVSNQETAAVDVHPDPHTELEEAHEATAILQDDPSALEHKEVPEPLMDDQQTVTEFVTENAAEGKSSEEPTDPFTPSGPPADESTPGGPPADESTPGGPPADESTPGGPPADESTPGGPPADESTPGGPPADESTPGGPLTDESTPGGPPADESTPGEPPADESTPGGPPADESTPGGPPADESTPGGPPADESTPGGPPADESTTSGEPPADESTIPGEPPADEYTPGEPPTDEYTPGEPPADEPTPGEPPADEYTPGSLLEEPQRLVAPLEDIVEEEEEEEEVVDRAQLINDVEKALTEQSKLTTLNAQLQSKIAEYLISRKKTEERVDPGRTVTDQAKRYSQYMAGLENLKCEVREMENLFQRQEAELKVHMDDKFAQVQKARAEFIAHRREQSLLAVSSRNGKKLSTQELDHFQSCEDKKELEVIQVRLESIKLQNKIAKLEVSIRQKEQLAEGLHMIDFEQLKSSNVELNEKIEERNEDILKLRKKIGSTVQVLTHVKEKLQFLQTENAKKKHELLELDILVAKRRDHLTRMKQARDSLRMDNLRLKQKGGLVAHTTLLRDYEEITEQNESLTNRLGVLQKHHSELSVMCNGLRRKVEQAKTVNAQHI